MPRPVSSSWWYGNVLQLGRRRHLLLVSERSRLPVILPVRNAKRLHAVFPDAACEMLLSLVFVR